MEIERAGKKKQDKKLLSRHLPQGIFAFYLSLLAVVMVDKTILGKAVLLSQE